MNFVPIIAKLRSFAPLHLAESWDNVGLLVDAPPTTNSTSKAILLTNDFTPAVLAECRRKQIGLVVCYHPLIFPSFNRLNSQDNWKAKVVVEAIQAGISLYTPHTAADACTGGVNDWLASAFEPIGLLSTVPITPSASCSKVGAGRLIELREPITLSLACGLLKDHLNVQFLRATRAPSKGAFIKKIAICAGSGASLFKEVQSADLFVTGEAGHHFALDVQERGSALVLCEHSTSERGWLKAVLKPELESLSAEFQVFVSEADVEPLCVV